MNLDKSKIEAMLFETAKRLQLNPKEPELYHDHTKINVNKTYTSLGRTLDVHSAKISIRSTREHCLNV